MKYTELDYLDFFTTPFELKQEDVDLANLPKNKYSNIVIIGRFQPLHYGHIYLIKQACTIAKKVTIGIGSANKRDYDNPFTAKKRQYMLEKAIKREGIEKNIKKIVHINDIEDDNEWIKHALEQTGRPDAIIGNNNWVNECFRLADIESIQVPLLQRGIYEGTRIRKFLREVGKL